MKFCLDTKCKRKGTKLRLNEFPRNRTIPDGRNGYCRACSLRRTYEYRERLRPLREAEKRLAQLERERASATKPAPVAIVKEAIEHGSRTRNTIRATTRLPWDDISEALRELVLDQQAVRIERVGRLGFFVNVA